VSSETPAEKLTETDEAILEVMDGGRVTAPYVADETDHSLEYIRSRLRRFVEHGHAHRVYQGLYELVDDPREE
jgi:predicted HTH transcriptional regulator